MNKGSQNAQMQGPAPKVKGTLDTRDMHWSMMVEGSGGGLNRDGLARF